jgi:hypothetical protein
LGQVLADVMMPIPPLSDSTELNLASGQSFYFLIVDVKPRGDLVSTG